MTSTDQKVSMGSVPGITDPGCNPDGVQRALKALEGRWKMCILFQLMRQQPQRFSALERAIPAATQKMLIQQLRALENDGLVHRTVFPEMPPHVEYSLTVAGMGLVPALTSLAEWSNNYAPQPDTAAAEA